MSTFFFFFNFCVTNKTRTLQNAILVCKTTSSFLSCFPQNKLEYRLHWIMQKSRNTSNTVIEHFQSNLKLKQAASSGLKLSLQPQGTPVSY